jgi:hypothetical protein
MTKKSAGLPHFAILVAIAALLPSKPGLLLVDTLREGYPARSSGA